MLIAKVMIDITKIQTFAVPPSLKTMQLAMDTIDGKYKELKIFVWVSAGALIVYYIYRKRKDNEKKYH
jgi:hypothetical protein